MPHNSAINWRLIATHANPINEVIVREINISLLYVAFDIFMALIVRWKSAFPSYFGRSLIVAIEIVNYL